MVVVGLVFQRDDKNIARFTGKFLESSLNPNRPQGPQLPGVMGKDESRAMSAIGWLTIVSVLVVAAILIPVIFAHVLKKRIKVTVEYARGTPPCTVNMRKSQFGNFFFAGISHPAELLGDKLEFVCCEPAKIILKRVRHTNDGSAGVSSMVEMITITARPKDMKAVRKVISMYHHNGLIIGTLPSEIFLE
jgi:hypothetical protein